MSDMTEVLTGRIFGGRELNDRQVQEIAAALSAAGFGPVQETAAAALRSVDDIWGSGGRSIVRLSELREASQKVLNGDWDNHLRWNLNGIAKERARAVAERGWE